MTVKWIWVIAERPAAVFDQAVTFWATVTGTFPSRRGDLVTLMPPEADPSIRLRIGDAAGALPELGVEDVAAERARAIGLGASVTGDPAVLADPGGRPFALTSWNGEKARPGVFVEPDGARSRLDQIALDLAPGDHPAGSAFWRELIGWEHRVGDRPEFESLSRPEGPHRVLLHRLDDGPGGAHLDLACSDRDASQRWHERLGARFVSRLPGWTVMRDPAGGLYCLTRRSPETGTSP